MEQIENNSEGRLRIVEGLYNLVSKMQEDGETLSDLTPILQGILENLGEFESLSSKRKALEDTSKDTGSERASKRSKRSGKMADTLALEGYEVIDWTVSYSVREHDCS